jgi:citrate lyase gamma subunit
MTQCWFQQQDSKTNVSSSLLSEVAGSLEESNIRITQNVSKDDNINLILKESVKVKME